MAVINLLSNEKKRDIKAARANVALARYCVALVLLGVLVVTAYGVGFWLVDQEERAIDEKLATQSEKTKAFTQIEASAEKFRKDLKVAKAILSQETSYSTFLMTLAGDLPTETILTNISLSRDAPVSAKDPGITVSARASSYEKVLQLKDSLEKSDLFMDVNIINAAAPQSRASLKGIEARYPYTTTLNVKLQKDTGAKQ